MIPSLSAGQRSARLAIVLAAGCCVGANVGKVPISLPALRETFDLSLFQASFILSMLLVSSMLIGVFGGMLADRFGPRRSMLTGLGLAVAGGLLGAMAQTSTQLFVSRAIESVALVATILPGPAMIARFMPVARLRGAMGVWSTYMPAGMTAALLLAPWVLSVAGWRALWVGNALVSAVVALLIWRVFPPDREAGGRRAELSAVVPASGDRAGSAPSGRAGPAPSPLAATLRSAGPWLLAACFGCYAAQWMSLFGFLPTLYADEGVGFGLAGALTAIGVAVNVVGNTSAGWLAQRGTRLATLLAFGSVMMLLAVWVIFASGWSFGWRYAAVLLFSMAGGLIPGGLFVATPSFAPFAGAVSTTTGLMQQGSAIGQFIAPPLLAMIVSLSGGWSGAVWLLAGLALVNIGLGLAVGRRFDGRPGRQAA